MERCGFFDANLVGEEYDRVYFANQFAAYFASFISNGVYARKSDELQVIEQDSQGMAVDVLGGQGWINGYWYENTESVSLAVDVADGVLNRIDSVVLRLGFAERNIWLAIKKGVPAISPVAPEVTRTADYYELQLATISIPAGSIKITQAQITDTRMNQDACGWVTGVIEQLDTTTLFNQFETYFEEFKQHYEDDYKSWFEHIKGQLSEDAAGKIQVEIDKTNDDLAIMKREIMAPYGYFGIEQDLDTLMEYVRAGQWDKFAIGDYFIDTRSNGQKVMWEVADKNGYYNGGETPLKKNNIICIPRDCLEETQQYNGSSTNDGGYANSSMPPSLYLIAETFSDKLRGYMVDVNRMVNCKNTHMYYPYTIMLPSPTEILGNQGCADSQYVGGLCHSLALFTGGNAHIMKGRGFNKSKGSNQDYWLADPSANNDSRFCFVSGYGTADDCPANVKLGLAPLIVLA